MSLGRLIGPVESVSVNLSRAAVGKVNMPDLVGLFRQVESSRLGLRIGRIEQTEFDACGIFRINREIDPSAVPGCPQGIRPTRPGPMMRMVGVIGVCCRRNRGDGCCSHSFAFNTSDVDSQQKSTCAAVHESTSVILIHILARRRIRPQLRCHLSRRPLVWPIESRVSPAGSPQTAACGRSCVFARRGTPVSIHLRTVTFDTPNTSK